MRIRKFFHEVRTLREVIPVIVISAVALLLAAYLYLKNAAIKIHNERMAEIAGYISEGAMTYLKRQYSVLALFIALMFVVIGLVGLGWNTSVCFLVGALFSIGAGFFGMKSATVSNVRTAQSAEKGLKAALSVAFSGGAVLGLCVVGLGALGLFVMYWIFPDIYTVTGFSLGASSIALFCRVGWWHLHKGRRRGGGSGRQGGKRASPRTIRATPAVIADNVGDNVGDVAGMGADLFESYVGAILSAMMLSFVRFPQEGMNLTMLIVVAGIGASIIGIAAVRLSKGDHPQAGAEHGYVYHSRAFDDWGFVFHLPRRGYQSVLCYPLRHRIRRRDRVCHGGIYQQRLQIRQAHRGPERNRPRHHGAGRLCRRIKIDGHPRSDHRGRRVFVL